MGAVRQTVYWILAASKGWIKQTYRKVIYIHKIHKITSPSLSLLQQLVASFCPHHVSIRRRANEPIVSDFRCARVDYEIISFASRVVSDDKLVDKAVGCGVVTKRRCRYSTVVVERRQKVDTRERERARELRSCDHFACRTRAVVICQPTGSYAILHIGHLPPDIRHGPNPNVKK